MRLRNRCLAIFLFLIHTIAFSQPVSMDFRQMSVHDGLSNSTIYCIYQDHKGFIWIGTENGLNCYDGYRFTSYRYDYQDPYSISGDRVTSIAEDKNGDLWIGVWDGGLNYYNHLTGKFQAYTYYDSIPNGISGNAVWSVLVDSYNLIWTGTINYGVSSFDPESGIFTRYHYDSDDPASISSNFITAIFEDSNGNLWIGTENEGLNLFDRTSNTFQHIRHDADVPNSLICDKINTLFEDKQQNLWIGTKEGFSVLSPDRKTFTNYTLGTKTDNPKADYTVTFCQDNDNRIWIGTGGGGIIIFDPALKTFIPLRHDSNNPKSITSDVLSVIYKSKDGIIWAGTFRGGLNIYDKKKYKFLSQDEYLAKACSSLNMPVMSVFEDSEENIWIGTDGFGLSRYDTHTGRCKWFTANPESNNSIGGNVIKKIYEDNGGNIWFGTWNNGLDLFVKDKDEFLHFKHDPDNPFSLSNNDAWDITEDNNGNLWIATLSGGLNLLDRKKGTFRHFRQCELNNLNQHVCDNVLSIIEDKKQGGLWIATIDGLSYYNPEKKEYINYRYEEDNARSISSNNVRILYQDSKYRVWFGTKNGGLNLYHPETNSFTSYGINEGLSSNFIAGIIEDDMHYLWVSTDKGISRFDPEKEEFSNYTMDDGLKGYDYLEGSVCKRKDGTLIFGYEGGIDLIHPANIELNNYIPQVYITKLVIANKEVRSGEPGSPLQKVISEQKEIRLKYSQSTLTFEFTALNFTNSEKNQYAYKLEDIDKEWNYLGTSRSVTFSPLAPGTYTLTVKASNNDGIWNNEGTSLLIHILPPWWRTLWFNLIIITIIFGIALGWYKNKIRAAKKQQLILTRLVNERTEELAQEKEKVEKQRDEIKEMSEKIHQADEEKLTFFTNISHEIRTPLTLILSPLDNLIASNTDNKPLQNDLIRIQRNASGMVRLVNQILDFRKIDSNNYPLKASKCNVVEVLKESVSAFYDIAAHKKIELNFISENDQTEAWLDHEKFEKIIYNLLSNAIKFTEEGGSVSVNITTGQDPDHNISAGYVKIIVKDSGIGIPSDQLDKIFSRFYQVGQSSEHHSNGTGIGLSIARSMAELHHGMITVESEVGKGTWFTVWIPMGNDHLKDTEKEQVYAGQIADEENHPDLNPATSTDSGKLFIGEGERNRLKLLIVEDNYDLRCYLKECFEKDYTVIEAADGKEGLKMARKELPSLIISDIMMPKMNGIELCRMVKKDIRISHIPVIMLTAKAAVEFKLEGLETGADDYIAKPFSYKELKIRMKNILTTREFLKEKFRKELVLKPTDIVLTSIDEKFLKKAIAVVEQHISDMQFNIPVFSSEMAVSRTVLHTKLKELTGQSASDFIRTIRLKRAAQLLVQKGISIAEVSVNVGIDPKYFSKCFKKQFGVNPGKYIQEHSG